MDQRTIEPAEATLIFHDEFCEALKRAGARIASAGDCSAPTEVVVAAAVSMMVKNLPEVRTILFGMLENAAVVTTGPTH